jgi:flagellar hook-length control protein FliK
MAPADIAAPGPDAEPSSTPATGFAEQLAAHGAAVPIGTQAPADPAGQLPMAPAGAVVVPPVTIPAPSAAVVPPASAPAPVVADLNLTHPLSHPDWQQAVATRVIWIANQDLQAAQIKLTPAHLGPIEVRIALHQDRADVWFAATSQPVREALEAALPRLRDMFSQQGLQLGQAAITSDSGQGQPSSQQERPRFTRLAAALEDPPRLAELSGPGRPGLFDGYA